LTPFTTTPRLVSIVWVLALVAYFFLLGESLPRVLDFLGLLSPLLTYELGNLGVGESRVLSGNLSLVVLSVKNEGCNKEILVSKC
jgi:hypothetical protein